MANKNTPSVNSNTLDAAESKSDAKQEMRLLADIGGTNARFCMEDALGRWHHIRVLPCAQYAGLAEAAQAYLQGVQAQDASLFVVHAAVAIANPVHGDWVEMTNHHWKFSIEATRNTLGLENLFVTNDFTALAMALPYLSADEKEQIGGEPVQGNAVLGLMGAGTGLGVSGLIPADDRWISLGSEGGHISYAPGNKLERDILGVLAKDFPHVSAERLISGPGLQLIFRALSTLAGKTDAPTLSSPEIVERGLYKTDPVCVQVLHVFSGMLGSMAGNVALMLGSLGGVYLGGGVALKMGAGFDRAYFRERFEEKGRFAAYLHPIPCYLITAEFPAFLGVSAILRDELAQRSGHHPLIEKLRGAREQLAPAERAVLDFTLANARSMTQLPVAAIAQRAGVSEPTVIRFCRSMGFQGLSDFKLQLASGLSGTVPLSFSQVHWGDATPDYSAKVLDNTISALLQTRENINPSSIDHAVTALSQAARIEIFALGQGSSVALDAQNKFICFGAVATARCDDYTQSMAAAQLKAGDVLLIISRRGEHSNLLQSASAARATGAHIVALCPARSPLAQLAHSVLATDGHQELDEHISPMLSRTVQLSLLDVLAVGVEMRLGRNASEERGLQSKHFGD